MHADQRSVILLSVAGMLSGTAILLVYLAFQFGKVAIVSPMINTAPLFILLISRKFLGQEEIFSSRVVMGTVLIVGGVVLVSTFH